MKTETTNPRAAYHLRRARTLAERLRSSLTSLSTEEQTSLANKVLHHTSRAKELS